VSWQINKEEAVKDKRKNKSEATNSPLVCHHTFSCKGYKELKISAKTEVGMENDVSYLQDFLF